MKTPDTPLHILPFESISTPLKSLKRGDWVLLPSGGVVEVFGLPVIRALVKQGDVLVTVLQEQAVVRYLDEDGVASNVPFTISRAWLMRYGRAV